ncbi:MAG: hypothetical protein ACREKK_00415 [Candidatus Methylomirabilales bacterium]
MALSLPIELLDLPAGGELVTRVTRFEQDTAFIKPARAPQGVTVSVVRLHVPLEDKATAPPWWDVTATTLQPSLVAALPAVVGGARWIRIRKQGVAPRARFSLEVLAPDFPGPAFVGLR